MQLLAHLTGAPEVNKISLQFLCVALLEVLRETLLYFALASRCLNPVCGLGAATRLQIL